MPSLVDSSILIPALPIISALLIGILLVSFNRTMNRLTKPVSFLIINSAAFSTLYALYFVYKHVSGKLYISPLEILNLDYKLSLNLNNSSEISAVFIGIVAIFTMLLSYFKLPRSKGYVAYLVFLSASLGLLFLFAFSNIFSEVFPFKA